MHFFLRKWTWPFPILSRSSYKMEKMPIFIKAQIPLRILNSVLNGEKCTNLRSQKNSARLNTRLKFPLCCKAWKKVSEVFSFPGKKRPGLSFLPCNVQQMFCFLCAQILYKKTSFQNPFFCVWSVFLVDDKSSLMHMKNEVDNSFSGCKNLLI